MRGLVVVCAIRRKNADKYENKATSHHMFHGDAVSNWM